MAGEGSGAGKGGGTSDARHLAEWAAVQLLDWEVAQGGGAGGGIPSYGGASAGDISFATPQIGPVVSSADGTLARLHLNKNHVPVVDLLGPSPATVFTPLIGFAQANGTASSATINVPAGTLSGHVMIAVIDNRGSQTITTPTGWTLIRTTSGGVFDSTPQLSTFYRVAGGSEPASYTWSFSASSIFDGGISTFANVNTTTPIAQSVEEKGSTGEPSLKITSLSAQSEVLFCGAVDPNGTGNGSMATPLGFINVWDSGSGSSWAHSHLSLMAAGAANSVTASTTHLPTGANFAVQLLALTPASTDPASVAELKWQPPILVTPTTVTITPTHGTLQTVVLPDTDCIVSMPTQVDNALSLVAHAGRQTKLIGGEISIPTQAGQGTLDNTNRRALLIAGGAFWHVEGLMMHGVDINEGIDVACPDAIVQIQNCRGDNMHARDEVGFTDNHVDFIQAWGGCSELRVDKCTWQSDYQGITLKDDFNHSRMFARISRVNARNLHGTAQYQFWADTTPGKRGDVWVEDFWIEAGAGIYASLGKQVWPDINNALTSYPQRAQLAGDGLSVTWPSALTPGIYGTINKGVPSSGDFVSNGTPGLGVPGIGYSTPGYQYAAVVPVTQYTMPQRTTDLLDVATTAPTDQQVLEWSASAGAYVPTTPGTFTVVIMPMQHATSGAPAYVKGGMYFDTTLNKLRIGGATAWETVTSA